MVEELGEEEEFVNVKRFQRKRRHKHHKKQDEHYVYPDTPYSESFVSRLFLFSFFFFFFYISVCRNNCQGFFLPNTRISRWLMIDSRITFDRDERSTDKIQGFKLRFIYKQIYMHFKNYRFQSGYYCFFFFD